MFNILTFFYIFFTILTTFKCQFSYSGMNFDIVFDMKSLTSNSLWCTLSLFFPFYDSFFNNCYLCYVVSIKNISLFYWWVFPWYNKLIYFYLSLYLSLSITVFIIYESSSNKSHKVLHKLVNKKIKLTIRRYNNLA